MAKKLTEQKKKKLIADYVIMQSYSAVARKHKVSVDSVRRAVKNDPEFVNLANHKKKETEKDLMTYMDSQSKTIQSILGKGLENIDQKIDNMPPKDAATVMGILIDKWTRNGAQAPKDDGEDDAVTKALDSLAKEMEADHHADQ